MSYQKNKGAIFARFLNTKCALKLVIMGFACFILAGCSSIRLPNYPDSSGDFKSAPNTSESSQKATMRPYTINGKTYYPTSVNVGDIASGMASWYGPKFHGKKTSNGEIYNMNAMTAAHKTLPMNTIVKVTNLRNNRITQVRINDRGPFVAGRIIDLSKAAAGKIDMLGSGTAPVKLEVVGFYGDASGHNIGAYGSSSGSDFGLSGASSTYSGTGVSGGIVGGGIGGAINQSSGAASIATPKLDDFGGVGKISTASSAGVSGVFMVQLGAFKNQAGAQRYKQKYNGLGGYKTIIKSYDDGGGLYRVFLTGFRSESEVKDFINAHSDLSGAFIVRE